MQKIHIAFVLSRCFILSVTNVFVSSAATQTFTSYEQLQSTGCNPAQFESSGIVRAYVTDERTRSTIVGDCANYYTYDEQSPACLPLITCTDGSLSIPIVSLSTKPILFMMISVPPLYQKQFVLPITEQHIQAPRSLLVNMSCVKMNFTVYVQHRSPPAAVLRSLFLFPILSPTPINKAALLIGG